MRFHLPRLSAAVLLGLFYFSAVSARADVTYVTAGQACSLSVSADGTAPFSYQWFHDGVSMVGSTTSSYACNNFQASDTGVYYAVVSNPAGSTTTDSLTLAFVAPPVFTQHPPSPTLVAGSTATFTVVVTGGPKPTLQWCKNGAPISGATGDTYVIASVVPSDSAVYYAIATNSAGTAISMNGVLTVNPAAVAPAITTQPQGSTVKAGGSVTFTVAASGLPAPTYQWRKNGINIVGATSASYTIANVASGNAGTFTAVASNSAGSATSNGAVLVITVPAVAPAFTTQPASLSVASGGSATFTAAASGSPAPTYQWRKNGINIVGATGGSYVVTGASSSNAGTYTVVATNSAGSVTSNGAILTVTAAPSALKVGADFNGDGRSDIVWQNVLTGQNNISIMSGTNSTATVAMDTETPDWVIVGVGDFNSDGKPDILWENSINGRYGLWLMNGPSFSAWIDLGVEPAGWRIEGVGDFNGDGKADIIWQNISTHERTIQLMNGTTAGATISLGWVDPEWHVAGTGDFDGDGKTDILWQSANQARFGLWLMNGATYSQWVDLGTIPVNWFISGCGDYNGDGKTDILWENGKTGDCKVWFMNGYTFMSSTPLATVSPEWIMAN